MSLFAAAATSFSRRIFRTQASFQAPLPTLFRSFSNSNKIEPIRMSGAEAQKVIIGITGTNGAGKGTVVEVLMEKHGFKHYSARGYLTKILNEQGWECCFSSTVNCPATAGV